MEGSEAAFDQWCVVELFGHQVIAGRVSEQVLGGSAMLRVDVPAYDGQPAYTRFFGHGAIYSITPVSEEIAMAYVMRYRPRPIDIYVIQSVALPAGEYEDIDASAHEEEEEF